MHTIYAFTLRVLILAAVLYIVARKLCSGKTIPIKTAYERQHILPAPNAAVAQTFVGIDDLNFMKMWNTHTHTICLRCSPQAHLRMPNNLQRVHFIP